MSMAQLTPEERDVVFHALGLDRPGASAYRNHFVADAGHDDEPALLRLVEIGFMRMRPDRVSSGWIYHVTDAGQAWAAREHARVNAPSNPVLRAARTHGLSLDHAYLLADICVGLAGRRTVWPEGHPWRLWAITKAWQDAGPAAVLSFLCEVTAALRAARAA